MPSRRRGELPILLEQVIFPGLTTLISGGQSKTVVFLSIVKNQKAFPKQLNHCFSPSVVLQELLMAETMDRSLPVRDTSTDWQGNKGSQEVVLELHLDSGLLWRRCRGPFTLGPVSPWSCEGQIVGCQRTASRDGVVHTGHILADWEQCASPLFSSGFLFFLSLYFP